MKTTVLRIHEYIMTNYTAYIFRLVYFLMIILYRVILKKVHHPTKAPLTRLSELDVDLSEAPEQPCAELEPGEGQMPWRPGCFIPPSNRKHAGICDVILYMT